jgi:hypothetical protein
VSVGAVGVVAFLEQPVDAEGTILHPFEMSELASISLATIAVEEEVAVLCILILHFGNLHSKIKRG